VTASAAILAGGRARRFGGRDKSQIEVGGRTILARQIDALATCVSRIFLVGRADDAPFPATVVPVRDRASGQGPLGGLHAALEAAGQDVVLLLACDMPNVTSAFLSHLVGSLGDAEVVVPRTDRGYHPLCAVYAQSCRTSVQRRLERGQLRVTDLLDDLQVRVVDAPEIARFGEANHLLANVNSQSDLHALKPLQNH
jgi:molybdopterin-guanine dinucleotide biosynthesis protein A